MLKDDGDIVRGVGYVAIYSAYLEEQIDNVLEYINLIEMCDLKQTVSRKIKHVKKVLETILENNIIEDDYDVKSINNLYENLDLCTQLFEKRNEIMHGYIENNMRGEYELLSGRHKGKRRIVESEEMYALANELSDLKGMVYGATIFTLKKMVIAYQKNQKI